MAVTGLLLFAFVVVHLAGNLQVYLGPEPLNAYAQSLKDMPALLWGARAGLLAVAVLHVWAALSLARENRRARPVKYTTGKPIASSFGSRTTVVSGLVILFFILFHLGHFTLGFVDPSYMEMRDPLGRMDVYGMMIKGFSNPLFSILYIVSMVWLFFHLSHGLASTLQSLGLRTHRTVRGVTQFAFAAALVILIGNCSIPLAILAGLVR